MSSGNFAPICGPAATVAWRSGKDVKAALIGPAPYAARFAAEFGRQPNPQETEDLLAFVRGNIVKER